MMSSLTAALSSGLERYGSTADSSGGLSGPSADIVVDVEPYAGNIAFLLSKRHMRPA